VPEQRIIPDELWERVRHQIERRRSPDAQVPVARQNRKKHLLSGLIRCSCCGSGYTISGKNYYRCAGQKERGTCKNRLSVRKASLEAATLAIFQHHLLTEDHARLFADEFTCEMGRLTGMTTDQDRTFSDRLAVVEREIENLAANMLAGVVSSTLVKLLSDREAEKAALEVGIAQRITYTPAAAVLPHPMLLRLFEEKVGRLRETLDDELVRGEAAEALATLIESVTIYPDAPDGPEAEVVARVSDLLAWATNDNAAREGGVVVIELVAGTGFEPVTFRL
jgi:site-specific DNA recombinase